MLQHAAAPKVATEAKAIMAKGWFNNHKGPGYMALGIKEKES